MTIPPSQSKKSIAGAICAIILLSSACFSGQMDREDEQAFDWRADWALIEGFSLDIDSRGFSFPTAIAFVPDPGSLPGDLAEGTFISRSMLLTRVHAALSMWLFNSNEIKVGGFRVQFDPRDRVVAKKLALYGGFEEAEINILCSLSSPGDCVLDVEASDRQRPRCRPNGRVIAVEPEPGNLSPLSGSISSSR